MGFASGKSTLLSSISEAKPKIASYAFTTLTPNIGIVQHHGGSTFAMADIPGIIEDAHLGRGLGLKFLRHIERNAALLFVIPCDSDNIMNDLKILKNELFQYNRELSDKPYLVAISKCDILGEELTEDLKKTLPTTEDFTFISGVSGVGLTELKDKIWDILKDNLDNEQRSSFEEEE